MFLEVGDDLGYVKFVVFGRNDGDVVDVEEVCTLGSCTGDDDEVVEDVEEECTLGSCTVGDETFTLVDTLGSDAGISDEDELGTDGKISFRFKMVANLERALNDGSPACSDGQIVEGGFLRRDTRSVAVCFKKSINFT